MARQKLHIISRGLRSLLVPLALFISIFLIYKSRKKMTIKERLESALKTAGLNPTIIAFAFAQAAHETGNFTSPLYFSNNNCYGMKQPSKRQTMSEGERWGYASYSSIEMSAADFVLWYKYVGLPNGMVTLQQYVQGLKNKSYFEASLDEYTAGVQNWFNKYYS